LPSNGFLALGTLSANLLGGFIIGGVMSPALTAFSTLSAETTNLLLKRATVVPWARYSCMLQARCA
jgi:fluoride ion exporter CrcB/FEX